MLTDETKTYEALLHLGIATDTQDMSGTVTAEAPVTVTEEEVRDCIASFVGGAAAGAADVFRAEG